MVAKFGPSPFKASNKPVAQQRADLAPSCFHLALLNEMLKSHNEDGVKVAGAIGWSFVDNWEGGQYDDHFGVQGVDNATLKRYYKRGVFDFVDFVVAHGGK